MNIPNNDKPRNCQTCGDTGILLIHNPHLPPDSRIQICSCDAGARVNNEMLKVDRERIIETAYKMNSAAFLPGDMVPKQPTNLKPPADAKTAIVLECQCRRCHHAFIKTFFVNLPSIDAKVRSNMLVQVVAEQGVSVHHCQGRYLGFAGIAEVLGGAFYPIIHTAGLITP